MVKTILIEAISVGLLLIPLGFGVLLTLAEVSKRSRWYNGLDRNIKMALGFFISGFITHLFCEFSGINQWYCRHGNACKL